MATLPDIGIAGPSPPATATVIARFSPSKIGLQMAFWLLLVLVLATITSWHADLSHTVARLDLHPGIRIAGELLGACAFAALAAGLVKIRLISDVAVYLENNSLVLVRILSSPSVKLEDIASIYKWIIPGMIAVRKRSGGMIYIPSGLTDISSAQIISKVEGALTDFGIATTGSSTASAST